MNRLQFPIKSGLIFFVIWCTNTLLAQPLLEKLESPIYKRKFLTDNSVDEISYEISMTKKRYRFGERKIVKSTIKNIGKRTIRVRLPHAIDEIVTYKVFQDRPEGRQKVGESLERKSGSLTRILRLAPGETCSSGSELDFVLSGGILMNPALEKGGDLKPGKYFLQATYHLGDPEKDGYRTKTVTANEIAFTVRELTEAEAHEFQLFLSAYAKLFPFKSQNVRPPGDATLLEQFQKDYPDSPYRLSAFNGLKSFYFKPEDMTKTYSLWKQAREEGLYNQLCEEMLDYLRDKDMYILLKADKLQDAIAVLKGSRRPFLIYNRRDLEKRLKKKQADKKKNNSTKEIPKENKVDPPQTSKPKVTETNEIEPPVATNDSYTWTIVTITFLVLLALIAAWKFFRKKQ
ncbi:hypothetical protein MNBD_PLANCTO02-2872 [hydrothermal vent metagenome]|uniref:Uncharacterized protein n=1 Tax=hydrothermal vent metagenome TaxID=652676 RepID=A0A3B1DNV8_9ZZZZ